MRENDFYFEMHAAYFGFSSGLRRHRLKINFTTTKLARLHEVVKFPRIEAS